MTIPPPAKSARRTPLPPRWFIRVAWAVHRAIYALTRGRLGLRRQIATQWGMMRLKTTGRRSGKQRRRCSTQCANRPQVEIQTYAVEIDGRRFPVKQVLAQALRIPATRFVSTRAQALLEKLGFEVINVEVEADGRQAQTGMSQPDRALELAVQLFAGRTAGNAKEVLEVADAFNSWLRARF